MGAYQYVAVDPGGKEHRGVLEGDTPRHVRQLLRERQLLPVEVAEVEERERKSQRRFSLFKGISGLDLALLTRQLATLVKAGLPLEEALLAVSEHTEKPRLEEHHPRRARQGARRSLAGVGSRRFSARVPARVPRDRHGRRAGRPARFGARATCRLHRVAPRPAPESRAGDGLSDPADDDRADHHRRDAGRRRPEGRRRVRDHGARAADDDASADCDLELRPELVVLAASEQSSVPSSSSRGC